MVNVGYVNLALKRKVNNMNEQSYKKHLKTVLDLMRSRFNKDITDYNFIDDNKVELKDYKGVVKAVINERQLTNLWNDAERGENE